MLGKKVVLTKNEIKWTLDNLDWLYTSVKGLDPDYDLMAQHCLLQLMGEPVVGVVTGFGNGENVYRVEFETPFGYHYHYYEYPKSIKVVG